MSNRSDSQEDEIPRQRRRADLGQSSGSDNDDDENTGMSAQEQRVPSSVPIGVGIESNFAQIIYHSGIIQKSDINQFKRLLFRATKGKVLTKICDNFVINYDQMAATSSDS